MKGFLGTDPYQNILYKGRLHFAVAVSTEYTTKMLFYRLRRMAKNDGF